MLEIRPITDEKRQQMFEMIGAEGIPFYIIPWEEGMTIWDGEEWIGSFSFVKGIPAEGEEGVGNFVGKGAPGVRHRLIEFIPELMNWAHALYDKFYVTADTEQRRDLYLTIGGASWVDIDPIQNNGYCFKVLFEKSHTTEYMANWATILENLRQSPLWPTFDL